ncbi:putative ankyrin repeat protein RBE_0921 [Hydractinia symbiolongicarpus]|uniref:putative ankyrin repeat protein RBE_0921 n=1 Tax=Hydractinia symbiolongicarpus TaxID=13093 RepID=UPI00254E129B|nr:putative ankyrin repeat protein RBE_0921 [Hydractinia symbiolongicarpus]
MENDSDMESDSTEESDILIELILNQSPIKDIKESLENKTDLNYCFNGWSPLHYATSLNNIELCRLLVQLGSNVNFVAKSAPSREFLNYGHSPFAISCSRTTRMEIFHLFLENDGDVNSADPYCEKTPLMHVVYEPDKDEDLCSIEIQNTKLESLLQKGADFNETDRMGKNVLHFFNLYTETEEEESIALKMIRLIIDQGIEFDKTDIWGNTPLRNFSEDLRPRRMSMLIKHGANINATLSRDDSTMIHSLSYLRSEDYVTDFYRRLQESLEVLTNAGLGINTSTTITGDTLLHEIVSGELKALTIQKVIEWGADVNQKNCFGYTPLHTSLIYKEKLRPSLSYPEEVKNRIEVSRVLLENGADINTRDINQMTPLMGAAKENNFHSVKLCIECRADVNAIDKFGRTALHHCFFFLADEDESKIQQKEISEKLLKSGIDVNIRDRNGCNAAYYIKFLHEGMQKRLSGILVKLHGKTESSNEKLTADFSWENYKFKLEDLSNFFNLKNEEKVSVSVDSTKVFEIIDTAGIGAADRLPETSKINEKVEKLVQKFSEVMTYQYSLKCTSLISGGVSEGSKVAFPDEFDYLLICEDLSNDVEPELGEDTEAGFVNLKCEYGYFSISKFTPRFSKLAFNALSAMEQDFNEIYWTPNKYGSQTDMERGDNEANFLITLEYPSINIGQFKITVDIVPVISLPSDFWPDQMDVTYKAAEGKLYALLMKCPGDDENDIVQTRISTSSLETNIIKNLPKHVKNAFIALKALREISLAHNKDWYSVDTYILKSALLKYVSSHVEHSMEAQTESSKILNAMHGILSCVDAKSFFFPEVSLRETDNEFIYYLQDNERKEFLQQLKGFLKETFSISI